jgi:hypothetical protein
MISTPYPHDSEKCSFLRHFRNPTAGGISEEPQNDLGAPAASNLKARRLGKLWPMILLCLIVWIIVPALVYRFCL